MGYRPPRNFRDFERRPDFEGGRDRRSHPPFEQGARGPQAPIVGTSPLQRNRNTIARPPVDFTSETNALGFKRVNGQLVAVHKGRHEVARSRSAISAELAKKVSVSSQRVRAARAKPSGADRRMFNPTSGPKTFYGTFARIVPSSFGGFRFVLPRHVVPCVQRTTRREVLFALKKAGGASSRKKKRFTENSKIGC